MVQKAITSLLIDKSDEIYNPHLPDAITVESVSMDFNSASQQLNSFKEYFIALAKRELMFKQFRALDNISLTVQKGDVFGILGTNGSGKSTLMKVVSGVLDPTEGNVSIQGNIAPLIELGAGFDFELTARENIFLNGALLGYSKSFIQQHFEEIVDFAEIRDFLDVPLKNYSSGMVSRIAFAIATVIVPDILIVDEVLSVGDFMFRQKCEKRIQSLIHEHGTTVLIVSHSSDQIERLCNKAIWIEKGHVRMIGPAREVSRVYQALGGHTGTEDEENELFQLLLSNSQGNPELVETIAGQDQCSTNAVVAKKILDRTGYASFTICPCEEPSVYLTSLRLGLPQQSINLMTHAEKLSESPLSVLLSASPQSVTFLTSSGSSDPALENLRAAIPHDCNVQVIEFDDPDSLSLKVFDQMNDAGAVLPQHGAIAFASGKNLGSASAALAPFIAGGSPYFTVTKNETAKAVISRLIKLDTKKLVILSFGNNEPLRELERLAEEASIEVTVLDDTKSDGANEAALTLQAQHSEREANSGALFFSSQDGVIDALSAAPLVALENSTMLAINHNSLSSMVRAVEKIKEHGNSLERLVFLGGNYCFNAVDKEIFVKAATL